jgi:hypothetical protein
MGSNDNFPDLSTATYPDGRACALSLPSCSASSEFSSPHMSSSTPSSDLQLMRCAPAQRVRRRHWHGNEHQQPTKPTTGCENKTRCRIDMRRKLCRRRGTLRHGGGRRTIARRSQYLRMMWTRLRAFLRLKRIILRVADRVACE